MRVDLIAPLAPFILMTALLTLTPGADTVLVIRSAAASTRQAWGAVAGIQVGVLVWGLLATFGLAALLGALPAVGLAIRIAGSLYLLWIGIRLLVAAIRAPRRPAVDTDPRSGSFLLGLRQGAVTNLLNPKIGAYYVAVVAQVAPIDGSHTVAGVTLTATHIVFGLVWLGLLVVLVGSLGRWIRRPRVARVIDGVAGAAITGFGVVLGVSAVGGQG